jgi:diguanylate cyclase (GGDEF)-like protein/PAS domain S-box-containing protein
MHLNAFTAIILNITGTFFISLCLFFVTRGYLGQIKGIKYWAIGIGLQCVGWAFLPLIKAADLPPFFRCVGASLTLLSLAFYFHALKQFKESNISVKWIYGSVALAFCLQLAGVGIWNSEAYRIAAVSLLASFLSFAISFLLLLKPKSKLTPISHRLTGYIYTLCALVMLFRAYYFFFFNIDPNLLQSNTVQDVSYLTFYVTIVVGSFGFLLMCSDKYFVMQKELQKKLVRNEYLTSSILNSIKSHIAVINATGDIIAVNHAWREFSTENGMPQSYDVIGVNYFNVCQTTDQSVIVDANAAALGIRGVLTGEQTFFEMEYPCHSPTEERWFCMSVSPLVDGQQGAVVKHENITKRKKIELQLNIAAAAFEAQEGIMITDANNRILRVNQSFTNITGYNAEEVIGKTPQILSSGQQDAKFYQDMWASIQAQGQWNGKIWNRRKNGEIFPENLSITVVKDQQGVVTNYVATISDVTMSKTAAEEMKRLAFYDSLTNLPNRRLLADRLNMVLAANEKNHSNGALLFIDVDNFKMLNDSQGHDIGNLLLKKIATRLSSCVSHADTVARLGGDEFVILLEDLSVCVEEAIAQVAQMGEFLLNECAKPFDLEKNQHSITLSIGVTLLSGVGTAREEYYKQADIAMYQAKKAGGDALRFFDPQMQIEINKRVSLENDLRTALVENQFELYYQLQSTSSKSLGAEVLIRWHHPQRGFVSPVDFIPLAEETGLILPIGKWVLETACERIKIWESHAHTKHLTLAVNVSAKQFQQSDFVNQVHDIIMRYDIKPELLKLELTESSLVENIEDIVVKMKALREIGVRFSMDDFGTGYSSLSYLTQLPLDQLKIDQSFVRNIGVTASDAAIVQTIIGMAKNLGIDIIAEGVETEEQRAFLAENNCFIYQGFLFAKPLPFAEFELLI